MTKSGKTWWGRRFIEVLESFTDPARLAQGRQYLGSHRVAECEIGGSGARARIRGRASPYHGVHEEPVHEARIEFQPIPDPAWNEAIRQIGERAGFVCRLLFNEMPDEIEKPLSELGLSLLPGRQEVALHCDCGDLDNPCKHIAGLSYLLAARLDQDPFLLFELRGLSRGELARRLKATTLGSVLASALTEGPGEPRAV
jgi:uncharacterized Zn finger protein